MKKELFNELLESVREGGAILRGEREASRTFSFEESDVKRLRRVQLVEDESQTTSTALGNLPLGEIEEEAKRPVD